MAMDSSSENISLPQLSTFLYKLWPWCFFIATEYMTIRKFRLTTEGICHRLSSQPPFIYTFSLFLSFHKTQASHPHLKEGMRTLGVLKSVRRLQGWVSTVPKGGKYRRSCHWALPLCASLHTTPAKHGTNAGSRSGPVSERLPDLMFAFEMPLSQLTHKREIKR